jgi:quinoprotein glucose dehydrogenase
MIVRMPRLLVASLVVSLSLVQPAGGQREQDPSLRGAWTQYGASADSSRYVALSQITKANVAELEVAWTYPTRDSRVSLFNPIVVDGVMYVLARDSSLVALDAATGREIWVHAGLPGFSTRGVAYWESADRRDRRLIFTMNDYLQEIDAATGKSILTFGTAGLVDLKAGLGRDPASLPRIQSNTPGRIFENLILLGSAPGEPYIAGPGDLRAYDVRTGALVWQFHTIPQPGEFGYETWPKDAWRYAGGANTWGEITVDERRAIAYFPTGSPTYDYYGADRVGMNLFGNCLIAIDARTGRRLWHFQTVHHDLWDYDLTSAPQLITVRHNGRTIDAVSQASKQGFLYVFDRVTGAPLWPIEERPVPPSRVPGEQAWPTQPFPTNPPPFARQRMTADDVNSLFFTAEELAMWRERISKARNEGLFTPPGFDESLSLPGGRGGSNWGTSAADPEKGLVFLTTQDWPTLYTLLPTDPLAARRNRAAATSGDPGRALFASRCQSCHGENASGIGPARAIAGASRPSTDSFRQVVRSGRGDMPAFADLTDADIAALYAFLGNVGGAGATPTTTTTAARPGPDAGPVVASGGAPGGLIPRPVTPRPSPLGGPGYPAGLLTPSERFYTDWGLFPNEPYVIGPPWSELVAYDLNAGTIKWRVPLGEDALALQRGGKNTGGFDAQHHGLVVTATGLLFVATTDGKLRAYDTDTGAVAWTATLPAGSEGLPSMYEVNGRQFLVVPAMSPIASGGGYRAPGTPAPAPQSVSGAYVAFALRQ